LVNAHIPNPFAKKKVEAKTNTEKYGIHWVTNENYLTLMEYKLGQLEIANNEDLDIRIRVGAIETLYRTYELHARRWKNKKLDDRARGCEAVLAEWAGDVQKLNNLEFEMGRSIADQHLDPLSEEYSIKKSALTSIMPILKYFVGICGADEDIVPSYVAMFQTVSGAGGNRSPIDAETLKKMAEAQKGIVPDK
jgi:hypothetical protein